MLSERLKVLADPSRLNILEFLLNPIKSYCSKEEGVCACDLETFLGLKQSTISHHMKLLEQAGFVKASPSGRWVLYELLPEGFKELREALEKFEPNMEIVS